MQDKSVYLEPYCLKEIESWIEKVEAHDYDPDKSLSNKASKYLNLPYKVIGSGKKRITYDLGNGLVLKVAMAINGIKNNMTEVEIYHTVSSKLRGHLAEVIEYGYGWLIMEKVKRRVKKTKRMKSEVKRLQRRFKRRGISPNDLISRKKTVRRSNIRLNAEKKIVVIDYGNFKFL